MSETTYILDGASQIINEELVQQLRDQGHSLTGALEASITHTIDGSKTYGMARSYIFPVNRGVIPGRVPYAPGSGAGTSKYIDGLTRYFMLRAGLPEKEARSAAFATANKHKKEGMPTKNSYKYSSTGDRLNAIETAFEKRREQLDGYVLGQIDNVINRHLDQKSETI